MYEKLMLYDDLANMVYTVCHEERCKVSYKFLVARNVAKKSMYLYVTLCTSSWQTVDDDG